VSENWQKMLEDSGLSQEQLCQIVDRKPPTISGLIKHGVGGKPLKKLVRAALLSRIHTSHSELDPSSKPELSGGAFHDRAGESDLEIWKRRAKAAEAQLTNLRSGIRSLLELSAGTPPPSGKVNSRPTSEEEEILDDVEKHTGTGGAAKP
jgi:hypothetical protein